MANVYNYIYMYIQLAYYCSCTQLFGRYIMCLNLFYKSEGIDEVDKQRLRLVKRVMGGTGGKNPPSSKEKPVKETFIPPELSMVTFFMTKVRDVFTKHILNSQFCYHLFIKFFTILSHANFFTFSDYN